VPPPGIFRPETPRNSGAFSCCPEAAISFDCFVPLDGVTKVRGARGGFVSREVSGARHWLRPDQSPREEIAQGGSAGAKQRERNRRLSYVPERRRGCTALPQSENLDQRGERPDAGVVGRRAREAPARAASPDA
jgi:hypothetical protein